MAQYQVNTVDEPTMFAAAKGLGFVPASTSYAPGIVGALTGGVDPQGYAWACNIYGADAALGAGFFGILLLPDIYVLPGDTQTLASRVFVPNNSTTPPSVTVTPYAYGPVTITGVPANSPVVFS